MRVIMHGANDGLVVTPQNVGNIHADPLCDGDKGYFLPCECFDICPYVEENGGTMVGLKFEIAVVPSKAKLVSVFWENLATDPDVQLSMTYQDILGAEIEAIAPAAAITFVDDWATVDTSKQYHTDNAADAGYTGRGNAGILVIEVLADPNDALLTSCCGGTNSVKQPMLQWGIHYESANVARQRLSICNDRGNLGGTNLLAVDCAPDDMIALYDASDRKTEVAFALAQQAINQR